MHEGQLIIHLFHSSIVHPIYAVAKPGMSGN